MEMPATTYQAVQLRIILIGEQFRECAWFVDLHLAMIQTLVIQNKIIGKV